MPIKILVGPPVLTINRGSVFLVTDQNGEISADEAQGLFADDTRFLSNYVFYIDGKRWERVTSACTSHDTQRVYLTNPQISGFGNGPVIPADSLTLSIDRAIENGLHEIFTITNYGLCPVETVFEIEVRSDFSDLFEVKASKLKRRAGMSSEWQPASGTLATSYRREDYRCVFRYQVNCTEPPGYANGRLLFNLSLAPYRPWTMCVHMSLEQGERRRSPACLAGRHEADQVESLRVRWVKQCTEIASPNEDLNKAYSQSIEDMSALRLYEHDLAEDVWVPAAGVPWFVTLFGRDSLIASLQNMSVHPRFAEGSLRTLAAYQATDRDDWRDAQPGKIVHEVRRGELAHFSEVPHTRYYGTWDATPLFLIVLEESWRWLADRRLVQDLLPAARRCLEWIDRFGDLDGDGFQEYQTFSAGGYNNMGWKDAIDAVVYPDGSQVKQPKALCELQGYVYAAKLAAARLFRDFGDEAFSRDLTLQAKRLRERFEEAFWMPEHAFYAFGLDPEKKQIQTVASNAGHCLWSGIVDPRRAQAVVDRLLGGDMWSGWGIRTLSVLNPAYNPLSYQLGSVWPHDNSLIATGMKRYGFDAAANRVAKGVIDACSFFQSYRLPELYAGTPRQSTSFPLQYRAANVPQAWSAGSIFQFLATISGLQADAPARALWVDPTLPDWLPWVELHGLRVGESVLDLRFWREGQASRYEVLSLQGPALDVAQRSMAPELIEG